MEYEAASSLLDEGPIGVEDYVRAPIKPKTMRLVDPLPRHESRPTRRYVSDSLFESVVAPLDVDDYVVQGPYGLSVLLLNPCMSDKFL